MKKKILYIDMDGVLVDFASGIESLSKKEKKKYKRRYDECEGIFALMKPNKNAIEAFKFLSTKFDIYILSTAPWNNPSSWIDKVLWVQKYFGICEESPAYKRLILSHNKNLNIGDYLVDDRTKNGVEDFKGKHIHFKTKKFPNWKTVVRYLAKKEGFCVSDCGFL